MELAVEIFEALTIFCFGLSWPVSIRKSWKSRTAKGKSLVFELFLLVGYAFGIARKFIQWLVLDVTVGMEPIKLAIFILGFFFYVLNFIEISIDVALYFRNVKLDKERDEQAALLAERVEEKVEEEEVAVAEEVREEASETPVNKTEE